MRFEFQADVREYWARRDQLVKALAHEFGRFDGELAELLEKALPQKEPQLKWRALRDVQKQLKDAYAQQIKLMLAEVGHVLDRSAPARSSMRKGFENMPAPDAPGDKEPAEYQSAEDKQFAAEYDEETGDPRPEADGDEKDPGEPEDVDEAELEESYRARQDLEKAGEQRPGHKYIKREGGPGDYRYTYQDETSGAQPVGDAAEKPKRTRSQWVREQLGKLSADLRAAGLTASEYHPKMHGHVKSGFKLSGDTGRRGLFLMYEDHEHQTEDAGVGRAHAAAKVLTDAGWPMEEVAPGGGVFRVVGPRGTPVSSSAKELESVAKKLTGEDSHEVAVAGDFVYEVWKKEPDFMKASVARTMKKFNDGVRKLLGDAPHVRVVVDPGACDNVTDRASASYVLGKHCIRIKGSKGRGGIYHEYGHFLDHCLGNLEAETMGDMGTNTEHTPLWYFANKLEAAQSAQLWFKEFSDLADKMPDEKEKLLQHYKYLTQRPEMFARFFDQWSAAEFKKSGSDPLRDYGNSVEYADEHGIMLGRFTPEDMTELSADLRGVIGDIKRLAGKDLYKALYIGPRGGKWADPAHTRSWSPDMDRVHAQRYGEVKPHDLAHQVAAKGGKIVAHKTDPELAVVKVPHEHAEFLDKLKGELKLGGAAVKGEKYTMLTVPKAAVTVGANPQAVDKPVDEQVSPVTHVVPVMKHIADQHIPIKVVPHKTDPKQLMVKVPLKHVKVLQGLASAVGGQPADVQTGEQNALLPITKQTAQLLAQAMKQVMPELVKPAKAPKPPEAPKPALVEPHAPTFAPVGPVAQVAEIPKYAAYQEWAPPATVDEAHTWCGSKGIDAHFPDLASAQAVTDALRRSHPAVLDHVKFVGTAAQLHEWAKDHPDLAAEAKAGKHGMDLTEQSPLGGSAVAVAHPIGGKPYKASAIIVQPGWWSEHKASEKSKLEVGHFSLSNNLMDVVVHELGHVEGFALRHLKAGDTTAWEVWKKHVVPVLKDKQKKAEFMSQVSDYAATTPHEAWAEIAVMRRHGLPVPEWVNAAVQEMGIDKHEWSTLSTGWKWGGGQ